MSGRNPIRALRWRLRATARLWRPDATHTMPLLEPEPVPDGRLDMPGAGAVLRRGVIKVLGWVTFPELPCARVEIWLAGEKLGLARLGVPRSDLGHQLGPAAGLSGFELKAEITGWPGADGDTVLRAVAFDTAGTRHELSTEVRVAPAEEDDEEPEPPMPAAAASKEHSDALRTLVFTHQLTLGGAQFYLMDLLRELTGHNLIQPTVISALDGPLRRELSELGIPSHITSTDAIRGLSAHQGRVEELVAWARDREEFDVAFVNTATIAALPGMHMAEQLGIPAVWAIHESFPPAVLWGELPPRVRGAAERLLSEAAAVVFVAEATQRLFEPVAPQGRFLTLPYGVDFEPIERSRSSFDRAQARRRAGIPADAELVVCIGTVEPRKAQASLTQAFELIAAERPDARLALVGGRDDENARLLNDYIAASPFNERIELIPVTPDVDDWYGMADLLVCASDVESLPRSVIEAMAWELPVLATDVFGLPELIEDGRTGWLCAPRDVPALAGGLQRALEAGPEERAAIGRRAREHVLRRHSLSEYASRIGELLGKAAQNHAPSPSHAVGS